MLNTAPVSVKQACESSMFVVKAEFLMTVPGHKENERRSRPMLAEISYVSDGALTGIEHADLCRSGVKKGSDYCSINE